MSLPALPMRQFMQIMRRPARERMWHLDFARIVCVSCVVVEHCGGTTYSHHNVEFVLQWVLPFMYMTSGMCFMLSSSPLWFYCGRLSLYFLAGVALNWLADLHTRRDWAGDFGNTVYQMFYVVMLAALAFLTGSLRRALKWRRSNPTACANWKIGSVVLFWGGFVGLGMVTFVLGRPLISVEDGSGWGRSMHQVMNNSSVVAANTGGIVFLTALACLLKTTDAIGWVLLVAIYVPRVAMPYESVGFPHNVEIYLFGMVIARWPLQGADKIAAAVRAYWPLLLVVLMLLSTPNTTGRCDVNPPDTWWGRLRFYAIEFALVVSFSTGALNTSDPAKVTTWLNRWALFVYCAHVALHRVLRPPWGAICSYACIVPFYLSHRLRCGRQTHRRPSRALDRSAACRSGAHSSAQAAMFTLEIGPASERERGCRDLEAPLCGNVSDPALPAPRARSLPCCPGASPTATLTTGVGPSSAGQSSLLEGVVEDPVGPAAFPPVGNDCNSFCTVVSAAGEDTTS